jgi:hypothetical protein
VYVSAYVSVYVCCYLNVYILKCMSSTLAGSLVVSALLYSQYTEFHLEYADYDLRTYNTLATHQRTSDPVQELS